MKKLLQTLTDTTSFHRLTKKKKFWVWGFGGERIKLVITRSPDGGKHTFILYYGWNH